MQFFLIFFYKTIKLVCNFGLLNGYNFTFKTYLNEGQQFVQTDEELIEIQNVVVDIPQVILVLGLMLFIL